MVRMLDSLTVLIQTSPLPSHPSLALIEALFRSFNRVDGLRDSDVIILCDGCDESESRQIDSSGLRNAEKDCGSADRIQDATHFKCHTETFHREKNNITHSKRCQSKPWENNISKHNYKHGCVSNETADNYRLYLNRLQEKIDQKVPPFNPSAMGSIRLLRLPYRHGSAKAIATAFDKLKISTPYVMIGQHDNFFIRNVPYLQQILDFMDDDNSKSWLQCVHFPSTATLNYVPKIKRRYGLDLEKFCRYHNRKGGLLTAEKMRDLDGTFVPLVFWYGRTHIARTTYYTETILRHFPLKVGDHLEELWGIHQLGEIMQCSLTNKRKNGHQSGDNTTHMTPEDESRFREIHAKYGNYIFFDHNSHRSKCTPPVDNLNFEQYEVIYHLSGRKALAGTTSVSGAEIFVDRSQIHQSPAVRSYAPQGSSFTTARRAIAFVPGLEFPPEKERQQRVVQGNGEVVQSKPVSKRKFKQRCFHCGEKGHSFKYCPDAVSRNEFALSKPEVLYLS